MARESASLRYGGSLLAWEEFAVLERGWWASSTCDQIDLLVEVRITAVLGWQRTCVWQLMLILLEYGMVFVAVADLKSTYHHNC